MTRLPSAPSSASAPRMGASSVDHALRNAPGDGQCHPGPRRGRCYPLTVDPKQRPNRQRYLETLRSLTPEQRLLKAFELGELSHELLRAGIRQRYPDAAPDEVQRIYLEQLSRCQNRAY